MSDITFYEVSETDSFNKEVVRFVKKKKFKKLPLQIIELEEKLSKGEFFGDLIFKATDQKPYNVYKMRLPNPSNNEGVSDGYRVYYIVVPKDKQVVLLAIYYKKELSVLPTGYIQGLIDGLFQNYIVEDQEE